jgi:phenylacetate-CoA ligase
MIFEDGKRLEGLKRILEHAYGNSVLYRRRFDQVGIKPEDIKSLQDISKIPLLSDDLIRGEVKRSGDPFGGLLCYPEDRVCAISIPVPGDEKVAPKGWRGLERIPWLFGYTRSDHAQMLEMFSKIWLELGIGPGTVLFMGKEWPEFWQNTVYPSLWRIGARIYGGSEGLPGVRQNIVISKYYKPEAIIVSLHAAEAMVKGAGESGLDAKEMLSCYKKCVFTDGILTSELSQKLKEEGYVGEHYSLYSVIEAGLLAIDCKEHDGLHLPDNFIIEVIDEAGKPVPDGEKGRVVVTNLAVEATPYIRYMTHEIATLSREVCKCGKSEVRINLVGFQEI